MHHHPSGREEVSPPKKRRKGKQQHHPPPAQREQPLHHPSVRSSAAPPWEVLFFPHSLRVVLLSSLHPGASLLPLLLGGGVSPLPSLPTWCVFFLGCVVLPPLSWWRCCILLSLPLVEWCCFLSSFGVVLLPPLGGATLHPPLLFCAVLLSPPPALGWCFFLPSSSGVVLLFIHWVVLPFPLFRWCYFFHRLLLWEGALLFPFCTCQTHVNITFKEISTKNR